MLLPDVNVWIALAFDTHAHHPAAEAWFRGLTAERCAFCRMTQQGFLRLATNPKVMKADAVTMPVAWQMYDRLLADPLIGFADEPPGLEPVWRGFTQTASFLTHVWNDAYLAAFAVAGGYEVVTFDAGFAGFPGVRHARLP